MRNVYFINLGYGRTYESKNVQGESSERESKTAATANADQSTNPTASGRHFVRWLTPTWWVCIADQRSPTFAEDQDAELAHAGFFIEMIGLHKRFFQPLGSRLPW